MSENRRQPEVQVSTGGYVLRRGVFSEFAEDALQEYGCVEYDVKVMNVPILDYLELTFEERASPLEIFQRASGAQDISMAEYRRRIGVDIPKKG